MPRKKKQKEEEIDYEAMRQRALRPFKPSITDDDIREFEERIRERSIESMKRQKDELNAYDKEKISQRSYFEHHL